ncbi:unnamed protein product [Lasius platythorax]|uniref:Uncharacterized protein n=1 Tax=Lasius platythorax TaxID=488582 RepID=A0AAV2MVH6_9HYME
MVPDPLASSSSVGLYNEIANELPSDLSNVEPGCDVALWSPVSSGLTATRDNFQQELREISPSVIRENALDILASLGSDRRIVYNKDVYSAILKVMDHVDSLFSIADKLKHGRNYLLSKLRDRERHTIIHAYGLNSPGFVLNHGSLNGRLFSSPIEMTHGGELMTLNTSSRSPPFDHFFNSPSVLRGDDLEQTRINLSRLGTTLGPLSERGTRAAANQDLIAKIERVQERIDSINHEIATKNASLQILDAAAGTAGTLESWSLKLA